MQQYFNSLEEALASLSRWRGVSVMLAEALRKGKYYRASVRLRLDVSQLPKPLQLNAVTSREWNLTSPIHVWDVAHL